MSEIAQAKATHSSPQQKELPSGWRWVRLEEVCEKQTGIRDPRNKPDTAFQYVDITSVSNVQKCITEARTVLGKDAPSRARQVIRANDIIVATTRPNLNAVAQVPFELDNQICSTGFCVLRTGVDILPDYLFAFVRYGSFIEALADLVKGALYPAVNDSQVKSQQIPLPPLDEQRRISGVLREQMASVEKARAAAQARLSAVKALPAAFLRQVFPLPGQPLPDGWCWVKLGEVSSTISKGTTPTTLGLQYTDAGIPFLRAEDINGWAIEVDKVAFHISNDANETLSRSRLLPGDFLITIAGTLGRVGYVPLEVPHLNCNQAVAFARLDQSMVDVQYLCFICGLEHVIAPLLDQKAGGALQNLNLQQIRYLDIPLPPLSEQRRIAGMLHEQMATVEKARAAAQEELNTINALPAALLRRAFAGEL